MPYTGGTPPQLDAIIPSTNWLAWLNRDWTTLNRLSPESTSTAVGAGVYLEKTFTVVGIVMDGLVLAQPEMEK
jgi:hypothetical protein